MSNYLTRRLFLTMSLALLVSGCGESPEEQAQREKKEQDEKAQQAEIDKKEEIDNEKQVAYETSKKFVNDRLVSPGSAKYPDWDASDVSVTITSPGNYSISSYVDSQNAFGGLVRSEWTLTIHKIEDNKYHLDDINMTQR